MEDVLEKYAQSAEFSMAYEVVKTVEVVAHGTFRVEIYRAYHRDKELFSARCWRETQISLDPIRWAWVLYPIPVLNYADPRTALDATLAEVEQISAKLRTAKPSERPDSPGRLN